MLGRLNAKYILECELLQSSEERGAWHPRKVHGDQISREGFGCHDEYFLLCAQGSTEVQLSRDVLLPARPNSFQRGQKDSFQITLPDAPVQRIRLTLRPVNSLPNLAIGHSPHADVAVHGGNADQGSTAVARSRASGNGAHLRSREDSESSWHLLWVAVQPVSSATRPEKAFFPCFSSHGWLKQVQCQGCSFLQCNCQVDKLCCVNFQNV